MDENINIKMERLEAGPALDIGRFHENSSGQPSCIVSEGHCSSDPSACENIESIEESTEDSQDKDWKVSYLDYQVDSDDEDMETASDRDLDPDYDKSPDPDWDDGDSEDSDYKPVPRSAKRKKCFQGKGRGRIRESYQSKIDKLKLSLTQDVMSMASNVKGGKDIIKLHSLLAKDTMEQDKMLVRQTSDVSDKAKKERDETLRRTVKEVLSGRNLLPSLCGSDISQATVNSVANILHIDPSVHSSVVTGSHPSASLLLQSLIRTVKDNDSRTNDFLLQSSDSNSNHGLSVSADGGKQNLEGLSGRSFLLLQHLALQEQQKKHRLGSFLSFTRFLSPGAYTSSNGGSVLKSMLTEDLDTKTGVTSHKSDSTLLRKMLETVDVPPYETSCDGSEILKDEMTVSGKKELSSETFAGYTVYVDQPSSEEDVDNNDDGDVDDDDKGGKEFQQIPDIPALMPVKIKTEPLSPGHTSGAAESPPQVKTIPLMQIKPEPLSPTAGTEGDSLASQETSSRECEESNSAYDKNIIIKKEPDLPLTEGSRERKEDIQSQSGFHQHTSSHPAGVSLNRSGELSTLGSMQLKSEPVSPTLPTGQPDLWTNSCSATPNVSKDVSKLQSSDIPDLNLRSLLVNDDNTLTSMLMEKAKCNHSQPKNNVVFQNAQKYNEERPHYEQTISQKVPALKKEVTSDGDNNGQRDGNGPDFGISASTFLQSLSRLSSSSSGNKDTILRGLMEVESSTYLDSPSHSYNTRHKRKHQDISLLVEDKDTSSFGQDASASKYHIRDSAELKQSQSLSQALNQSRPTGLQEADVSESLSQNVNSCSQQLLNIIKSVGASKVTEEPMKKDVTILKSMLNSVNDEETSEPTANYLMMSRVLDTTNSSIGARSTTFLNQSNISPPIQKSRPRVPVAKQVSKYRMIKPKPSIMGTPTQTQIASLTIGLRKRQSRSAGKSCSNDTGMSTLPTECPYQCRLCGSAFRSTPLLEEHMHVHFGSMPFGCNLCPQSFMTASELEDHMKVHVSKLSPAVVYKCTVCGDVFDTEREHNEHRINHETFQQVQSTDRNKVRNSQHAYDQVPKSKNAHAKNNHTCKQCGEVFQDIHKYVLHVDEHSGWYKCERCNKVFVSKIVFQEHVLNCSGQNYICSECGMTFMSKMDLNCHIMFEHKQQSVTCGVCKAIFCYESHLKEHEVNQHESELKMMLQEDSTAQPNSVDDLSLENGCKISDMISLSVQRSSGSMAISDFAVQCMSDTTASEVVTISDSE